MEMRVLEARDLPCVTLGAPAAGILQDQHHHGIHETDQEEQLA
jgi:hypothetical protein